MLTKTALLALAALLLTTPSYAQATPGSTKVASLAADTVVTGTASGKARVRLTRATPFDVPGPTRTGSFTATGDGKLIGFALVAVGDSPGRVVISGGRVDAGRTAGPAYMAISHTDELPLGADRWVLPAGDYDLYLVTDGERSSIRFRFAGLTGNKTLRPMRPAATTIEQPTPRLLPQGQQTAGATARLAGPGLLMSMATTLHPFSHAQLFQHCVYAGARARTALHAPGCPDATTASGPLMTNPNSEETAVHHIAGSLSTTGGLFGQGYSLTNAGLNDHVGYTSLWLTF